jgi:hypothetical protein
MPTLTCPPATIAAVFIGSWNPPSPADAQIEKDGMLHVTLLLKAVDIKLIPVLDSASYKKCIDKLYNIN